MSSSGAQAPRTDFGSPEPRAGDHDLLEMGEAYLTPLERTQIRLVRATLQGPASTRDPYAAALRRPVVDPRGDRKLRNVHGLQRLPPWDPAGSVVLVANHRSFFDLYVTAAELVARGLPQRILFPVRSNFFYDHSLGPFVNGAMSFFAMYFPIFRDRKRATLNLASLDEVAASSGEGASSWACTRKGRARQDDDPYTACPAQSGIGRVIHKARVPVVPVFVNGLGNDLPRQVGGGITGSGDGRFTWSSGPRSNSGAPRRAGGAAGVPADRGAVSRRRFGGAGSRREGLITSEGNVKAR